MQAHTLNFLHKLLADAELNNTPEPVIRRQPSRSAELLCQHYNIGWLVGRRYEYRNHDLLRARALLSNSGLPLQPDTQAKDRASASQVPGRSEKIASKAPHGEEIAVMALSAGCHYQNTEISPLLPGYMVTTLDTALQIHARTLLVVENFETFTQLRRYHWLCKHPVVQHGCLAIFRGDNIFKGNHVLAFLKQRQEPVWTFPDFDPAGLGWSTHMPRFSGLLFPWDHMETLVRAAQRYDLYDQSRAQWENILKHHPHPDIQRAWKLMHKLWRGLNQEALRLDVNAPSLPPRSATN